MKRLSSRSAIICFIILVVAVSAGVLALRGSGGSSAKVNSDLTNKPSGSTQKSQTSAQNSTTFQSAETVSPPPASTQPDVPESSMIVHTASSDAVKGTSINATIYENSGTVLVNAVQAEIKYDANKLEFTGLGHGGDFDISAATDSGTPGLIRLARGSASAKSGTKTVAVLGFRAKSAGQADISPVLSGSQVVRSDNHTNVLKSIKSMTLSIR